MSRRDPHPLHSSASGGREHTPVLFAEAMAGLRIRESGRYLDATFGRGGHTAGILERLGKEGRVVAIDRDPDAIRAGRERFAADDRLTLVSSPFSRLADIARECGFAGGFDGVLFDLGVSSPQLDNAARGFSFAQEGPLDMRMNYESGQTAAEWLNRAPAHEIARVIRDFGEERFAKRISSAIVNARAQQPLTGTLQLAQIVAAAVPMREPGKHPATRTFQAIRIHVNREFDEIEAGLEGALGALASAGRLCAISFHSLEDALVKRFMQRHSQDDPIYAGLPEVPVQARAKLRRVGRAIHPGEEEVNSNPRARSAILRIAERVGS